METPAPPPPRPRLSRRKRLFFGGLVVAFGLLVAYGVWLVSRARPFYWFVKTKQRGFQDGLFRADGELGFAPVAGAVGSMVFSVGEAPSVRFDRNGFRVPLAGPEDATNGPRPHLLALGCSFTFGDGVNAEEGHPFKVARALGGTSLNAGGCAYGLQHVLLRGRALIAKTKPDVVLVLHATWLSDRARSPYAPTYFGKLTTPYFAAAKDGSMPLHSPVFETAAFSMPVSAYRETPAGEGDFASFALRVGVPLLLHDDLHGAAHRARLALGLVPEGAPSAERIVAGVYGELATLCRASGARLVILHVGDPVSPGEMAYLAGLGTVVDGQAALFGPLREKTWDAYFREYGIFRGEPPVMVDPHPNSKAHDRLAAAVVEALNAKR